MNPSETNYTFIEVGHDLHMGHHLTLCSWYHNIEIPPNAFGHKPLCRTCKQRLVPIALTPYAMLN